MYVFFLFCFFLPTIWPTIPIIITRARSCALLESMKHWNGSCAICFCFRCYRRRRCCRRRHQQKQFYNSQFPTSHIFFGHTMSMEMICAFFVSLLNLDIHDFFFIYFSSIFLTVNKTNDQSRIHKCTWYMVYERAWVCKCLMETFGGTAFFN